MKFDHTTKWYTQKPESLLENKMNKILWDFEIQLDHLILARRPDLVFIMDFAVHVDLKVEIKESKKINKYLDLTRELY